MTPPVLTSDGSTFAGCIGRLAGCSATNPAAALDGASHVAINGTNLYVTALTAGTVSHFKLSGTGTATFLGRLDDLSGCKATTPASVLKDAIGVASTPKAVRRRRQRARILQVRFRRESALHRVHRPPRRLQSGHAAGAMTDVADVAVSGRRLLVTGLTGLNHFTLDSAGVPSFSGCIANQSGCTVPSPAQALNGAGQMAFSERPLRSCLVRFHVSHRLAATAALNLAGCIGDLRGRLTKPVDALDETAGAAVSGTNLYATGANNTGDIGAVSYLTIGAKREPQLRRLHRRSDWMHAGRRLVRSTSRSG